MALLSAGVRQSPEDEFYTNLTLGLVKFLNSIQRITNITLNKQQPSERTQISTWEQRHNVYLADDMRRFYLSTDGFTLHWSYQYSRNADQHIVFRSIFVTHVVFLVCSQWCATCRLHKFPTHTANNTAEGLFGHNFDEKLNCKSGVSHP